MLPSARRRREETAAREAAGESLWSTDFDEQALVRIKSAWEYFDAHVEVLGHQVSAIMRTQAGVELATEVDASYMTRDLDTDTVLDLIAAVWKAINIRGTQEQVDLFTQMVNLVLNEHRIAWRFVEGELIPFASDELLQDVVEPALRLLVGEKFKAAHDAYMKALREIGNRDAGDAITDAGTALQESLNALGCSGNSLGPLIKDAKSKGILGGHDQTLTDGIAKMMDWASADRSETGDGHKHTDAEIADAWLMVHVVGALIVRLADPTPRGT